MGNTGKRTKELVPVNKYQTPITQGLLDSLEPDVGEKLMDLVGTVPLIRNLISPTRERAKDRPRDKQGRIIVDLSKPHILEDMDYFRKVAIHYDETGSLTDLKPSNDPGSPYVKWLKGEIEKIWNGMVRPSDGEWVTGYMYWYLNYCPIMLSRMKEGAKRADRVEAMPEMWEGIYWRFHYMEQASAAGKHCAELAARGRGKSFVLASILSHIFLLGDNKEACRGVTGIVTAASKEYLTKDGVLSKFARMIDFCSQKTQFPKRRIKNSLNEMTWKSGYKEVGTDTERGSLNTIIGVTSNDDESKIRGKRAAKILIEEMGCHLKGTKVLMYDGSVKTVEEVLVGDKLMGDDGTPRTVERLYSGRDMMYRLELENGDVQIVNSTHPVAVLNRGKDGKLERELYNAPRLAQLPYNRRLFIEKAIMHFKRKKVTYEPYDAGVLMSSRAAHRLFKGRGIPAQYRLNEQSVQLEFIAGFLDYTASETFWGDAYSFNLKNMKLDPQLMADFKFMCEACGLRVKIRKNVRKRYFLTIGGDLSRVPVRRPTLVRPAKEGKYGGQAWNHYRFRVSEYGEGEFYGFTVDGNHLFCLADLQITHNTFPRLLNLYNVLLPSVQEGDIAFGQICMVGTAGDSESDFSGAREILCNPDAYNMYALKNVYDKEGKGRSKFTFFFPGYVNRKGCYNHDGVSDVVKALIEILRNRHQVRKGSTDPTSITKTISEVPITPDEAMMRNEGNMFPVADCMTRLAELDGDPSAFDDVYVGELKFNTQGEVEFSPTTDRPIRDYPLKGNKYAGAVEIYEMPMKDDNKKVYPGRYIAASDPIDTDNADTQSLGSTFVLDLWTDRIVAEYTGRSMYVDDYNETTRKLCLFYSCKLCYENNRKGLFSYFSSHNCSYLLADNLEFLKDKQLAKPGVGNAAKGVSATQAINSYARNLLRSWLVAPIVIQNQDGTETTKARLFTLRTRALLRELVCYNPDGNFDRISSMGMLMLYREEKIILYQGDVQGGQRGRQKGYLGDDPFFSRNYPR